MCTGGNKVEDTEGRKNKKSAIQVRGVQKDPIRKIRSDYTLI